MTSILIALIVLASPILLWAVIKGLLSSGALSLDEDIRRLGSYDWFTRNPRERYYIRRDAAEILSRSQNPRARRYAVKCLRRNPNLAVLDECLDALLAGLTDSDPHTAQGCAELLYTCLADGVETSLGGYISGVAMSPSSAERYLKVIRQVPRSDMKHSTVANMLAETEQLLESYLHKKRTGVLHSRSQIPEETRTMNRRALLSVLYRMHGAMLVYSSVWGLLVGIVVVLLMKQTSLSISFTEAAGTCVIVGVLSWLFSLVSPMSFQLHKYILPMAMPLLGTTLLGISGMVIGYAGSFFLRIIGDIGRFVFMVMATGRGPDPAQYKPIRDIVVRPAFGFVVACTAIALTLPSFGVQWCSPGSGEFAAIIGLSAPGKLAQLPVFCLTWSFTRQLFESGIDIWTTPAFWSRR